MTQLSPGHLDTGPAGLRSAVRGTAHAQRARAMAAVAGLCAMGLVAVAAALLIGVA